MISEKRGEKPSRRQAGGLRRFVTTRRAIVTGGVIVSLLVGVTLSGCKQRLDEQKPDWPPTSGRPDWAPAPTRELKPEDIEGIFQPPPNPEFEEQRIQEILGREIPRDEARMITGR